MLEVLQAELTAVKDQLDTRFIDEHGRHLDKAGKNYFWWVVTERGAKVDFPESKVWAKFKKENGADNKGQLLRSVPGPVGSSRNVMPANTVEGRKHLRADAAVSATWHFGLAMSACGTPWRVGPVTIGRRRIGHP